MAFCPTWLTTSQAWEKLAEQVHRYYQGEYPGENRIDLPDFKLLKFLALMDFLDDGQFSPYLKGSLLGRIEVERPDLYRQLDQERKRLQNESQQPA